MQILLLVFLDAKIFQYFMQVSQYLNMTKFEKVTIILEYQKLYSLHS